MAHRTILIERQRSALFDLPIDEAAMLRHYTLADDDLEVSRPVMQTTPTRASVDLGSCHDMNHRISRLFPERVCKSVYANLDTGRFGFAYVRPHGCRDSGRAIRGAIIVTVSGRHFSAMRRPC